MINPFSSQVTTQITDAVLRVAPAEDVEAMRSDEQRVLNAYACAAWSGIGEPGDRMIAFLCDALTPLGALHAVMSGQSPSEIAGHLAVSDTFHAHSDSESVVAEALDRWKPRLNQSEGLAHLERAARVGAVLVTEASDLWPGGFADLGEHRPIALWLRGHTNVLSQVNRSVSIVGARASTGYGEHVTMELTTGLVEQGFAIVSGAAYGIDGMAHRAALASGAPTIAVLAGGIDRLYPSGHDALLNRIIETGAVVTELPCGFAPTKWRFLQRNRLIAAISSGTVVVEAGWRSGSLNTAHHALELDRPLGVVPGPVTSASSAGCHRLLRETPAVCVTTATEIVELVQPQTFSAASLLENSPEATHPFATRVLDALSSRRARTVEDVARGAGLSVSESMAVLGLLELDGLVREAPTGWLKQSA